MMVLSFVAWIFLLGQLVCFVSNVQVPCLYQDEACSCDKSETFCEFALHVEELQTFSSYEVDRQEFIRGVPGRTYFLNRTGFHPAVTDPEFNNACYADSPALYNESFINKGCTVPMTVDGVTYRRFIGVNGRIPGPTLIVSVNQIVKVRVHNNLTSEGITIHWHGMHQSRTPWMDGVGFISQYPIAAGEYFDYIFNAFPAGTHWYHSHVGAQRTDGLFGALVVREQDRYPGVQDQPENHTMTLLDWQREDSLDLFVQIRGSLRFHENERIDKVPTNRDTLYNPTSSIARAEVGPVPYWTGLINGRGRLNSSTYAPLTIFNVEQGEAYRFRVIGAQSLYAYSLSVDGHQLRVIATDGHFIQPRVVDYLIVHSGERYDFIINASYDSNNQNMFWIRAKTLEVNIVNGREHSALAILNYRTTRNVDWRRLYGDINTINPTCSNSKPCEVLNCPFANYSSRSNRKCVHLTQLRSLDEVTDLTQLPTLSEVCRDCGHFFNFGFEGQNASSAVNGRNFQLPVIPYQTNCSQAVKDGSNTCKSCSPPDIECRCTQVVSIVQEENYSYLTKPRTILFVFSAVGRNYNFSHPIHLHGHSFYILHIGHGEYNDNWELIGTSKDIKCNDRICTKPMWNITMPLEVENAAEQVGNLILKDTVIVPAGGYVVVAFLADNPGYWFLHCHIEVHQLEGMGVLIQEYDYKQQYKPPDNIDTPGHFDWTLDGYNKVIRESKRCGASETKQHLISFFVVSLSALLLQ